MYAVEIRADGRWNEHGAPYETTNEACRVANALRVALDRRTRIAPAGP